MQSRNINLEVEPGISQLMQVEINPLPMAPELGLAELFVIIQTKLYLCNIYFLHEGQIQPSFLLNPHLKI